MMHGNATSENATLRSEMHLLATIYRSDLIKCLNAIHILVAVVGIFASTFVVRCLTCHNTMNFSAKSILVQEFIAGALENLLGIIRSITLFGLRGSVWPLSVDPWWLCSIVNAGQEALTEVSGYLLLLLTIKICLGSYWPEKQAQNETDKTGRRRMWLITGLIWSIPLVRETAVFIVEGSGQREVYTDYPLLNCCSVYFSETMKIAEEVRLILIDCSFMLALVILCRSNKRISLIRVDYNTRVMTFQQRIWLDRSLKTNQCLLPILILHCCFFVATVTTTILTKVMESHSFIGMQAKVYVNEMAFQIGTSIIFCFQSASFIHRDSFMKRKFVGLFQKSNEQAEGPQMDKGDPGLARTVSTAEIYFVNLRNTWAAVYHKQN